MVGCIGEGIGYCGAMEYRRLGRSGMYVSEISYGNWITHGSQVAAEEAIKCVRAAYDAGITTFDTADVYAGTKAESVLGRALKGMKRESYELFTKVYWPTGPGKNDRGLSRKPQYSMLWRVIEAEVVPLSQREGIGQIVWSPVAQGVLSGKYLPGKKPPAGSRATDKKSGAAMISRWMDDAILKEVAKLQPIASDLGLTMAQLAIAWVLQNPNVSSAIIGASKAKQVKENVKAAGVKLTDDVMRAIDNAIGAIAERDPAKDSSPNPRP